MRYKVYFDQLPPGAGPVYESNGTKSYVVMDNGSSIVEVDHKKSGPRVLGEIFEIHCQDEVTQVLLKLIKYFENLSSKGEPDKNIIVAHQGFVVLPIDDPKTKKRELTYILNCAIFAIDVDPSPGVFSESLKIPISLTPNMEVEYVDLEFNGLNSQTDFANIIEVAKTMCA